MRPSYPSFFGLVASAILLTGCGGGGSSATTAQTATSFALLSGYKASVAAGQTVNYTISGTCSGSATITDTPPSAATFEGAAALAATETTTTTYTNCAPASSTTTTIAYYDSNYNPLGESEVGSDYGIFLTIPSQLPSAVNVGDAASYGTETRYSDSTKKTVSGTAQLSYVIEQDGTSTSTAIANFVSKDYNASNQLIDTQQSRYRLDASGTLTPISIDIQYANSNHLLLTAQ